MPSRRDVICSLAGTAAFAALGSNEERILASQLDQKPDAVSSASRIHTNWAKLSDLKKPCPQTKIGDLKLSRIILGGNLVSGWAHARDLIYVSDLVKAYHTKEKIFATFQMAEACGINSFLTNPSLCGIMEEYWDKTSGQIQYISNCGGNIEKLVEQTQYAIDHGAHSCHVHGEVADRAVKENKLHLIEQVLDVTRKNGLLAGISAHRIETLLACEKHEIIPDYWMKTFHHHNYWSAKPEQEHDNIFCREPKETEEFFARRKEPWIAFKTLAAGAIRPHDGFKFALDGGADFLCVGMYDFQVVDDVNLFNSIYTGKLNRKRDWMTTDIV